MSETAWTAPRVSRAISAVIDLPGSKSQTARELVLGAISLQPSTLRGALSSRDTDLMVAGLRQLGAEITPWPSPPDGEVRIIPVSSPREASPMPSIECGLAGTVMRFLPALTVALGIPARFTADAQANSRPLRPLLDALEALGAKVVYEDLATGIFPFSIYPPKTALPGEVSVDGSASSQFISALLLAAPLFPADCTIRSKTVRVPSRPHLEMTKACLNARGVKVSEFLDEQGKSCWRVEACRPRGRDTLVEPDLSNAGAFLAAVGIAGGQLVVKNWPQHTTQAGDAWREILTSFGMQVTRQDTNLQVSGNGTLQAVDLDFSNVGELAPVAAALAAHAPGTSYLRGLHHLRGHETDRLNALQTELTRLGIDCRITPTDDLVIMGICPPDIPKRSEPVPLRTYADHRLATFAALMGMYRSVQIDDIACTSKTLPEFPQLWQALFDSPDETGEPA